MKEILENSSNREKELSDRILSLENELSELNAKHKNFYDLTVLTNILSTRIKSLESEKILYKTLISELKSNNRPSSIYLLDESGTRLNLVASTIDDDNYIVNKFEQIVNNLFGDLKLSRKGFSIDLEKSKIYSNVVNTKVMTNVKTSDMIHDMFPNILGKYISKIFDYNNELKYTAIAPILFKEDVVGVLAMDSYRDKDYFLPFVQNLSKTVSKELERIVLQREKESVDAEKTEVEDIFENLYSNSPDGIMIGKIFYADSSRTKISKFLSIKANNRFRNLMGLNMDDLFEKDITDINPLHTTDFLESYIAPAMNGESTKFNIHLSKCNRDYSCSIFDLGYDKFGMILNDVTEIISVRKDLENTVSALEESVDNINILLKEVNHRTKNNLNVIASIVSLEKMRVDDLDKEDYVGILSDIENRIYVVSDLCETLYHSGDYKILNFSYFDNLAKKLWSSYDSDNNIRFNVDISENCNLGIDSAIPCGMILNEMISNSIKYAFPEKINYEDEKLINFSMKCIGNNSPLIEFVYFDNGVGMPKNYSLKNSKSLGITLISSLVKQLNGNLEVISGYKRDIIDGRYVEDNFENKFGVGTRYIIKF